jgi:hypothetical protein
MRQWPFHPVGRRAPLHDAFGEGCLQDALPYAHDAGPLIALALEEFEAVEPTSVTPLLAYSSVMEKRSYF